MEGSNGFWYPSMKVPDITRTLQDWGIQVLDAQIQKPTSNVVEGIYSQLMTRLTGITDDDMDEPIQRFMSSLEFPELYPGSLTVVFLLFHLRRVAEAASVGDLSLRDLTHPDPERTRSILSAIINLVKFSEEHEDKFKSFREEAVDLIGERAQVSQEIEELRRQVSEIKEKRKANQAECDHIGQENAKLTQILVETKELHSTITHESNDLKKQRRELNRQAELLAHEMTMVTDGINAMRSRIVQSPERIRNQINEMGTFTAEEKKAVTANDVKFRDLKIKLDALGRFEEDIRTAVQQLDSIQADHTIYESTKKKLTMGESELQDRHIALEQLSTRFERARRQLSNAEDKVVKAQQMAEERKLRSQQIIERLRNEYGKMADERRENDRLVEETREEADKLERKMKDNLKKQNAELNEFLKEYWNLRHQIEVYMETLANKFAIR